MTAHSPNVAFRESRLALNVMMVALALLASPAMSLAQQSTQDWTAYAAGDLNLRKGPGSSDAIFAVIPVGTRLERINGTITNDYAPVTYDGVTGWVINSGLVATPEEVELANSAPSPTEEDLQLYGENVRVTLLPLMLRSGPDIAAEPITGMPQGSEVILTREGYENGYVTVDYGGARGWAYADLLSEPENGS